MKLLQYFFLTVLFFVLASCEKQSSSAASVKKTRDSLVIAIDSDVISFDPHASNDSTSALVNVNIYDTILHLDADTLEVTPGLAKNWKKIDDLTWEFELFEGIKFHNGDLLTVEDIDFTVKRGKESSKVGHLLEEIERVEKISKSVFRIITTEPFAPLAYHLTHAATGIISKRAVTEGGKDYGIRTATGTGPFKLQEAIPATSVTIVRNDDYFQGPAKLAKVEYKIMVDEQSRSFSVEAGDSDIVIQVPALEIKQLQAKPDLTVLIQPTLRMKYIGMNNKAKYLKDPKVRIAISHAIDAQAIIDAPEISGGREVRAGAPLSPLVFGYSEIEPFVFDPELAKKILDEAGYPIGEDGTRFSLEIIANEGVRVTVATYVQAFLKDVGIDLTVHALEWATVLEKTATGDSEMFVLGWTTVTADANYGLFPVFHSKQHGYGGGRNFYSNAKVDQLLSAAKLEMQTIKRKELYGKALKIIASEAACFPISYPVQSAALKKEVKGFKLHPARHHRMYPIYIEE